MTLVLAVRCTEGVVIAADSQATAAPGGHVMLAYRTPAQKLFRMTDYGAWGATGPVGVIQNTQAALSNLSRVFVRDSTEAQIRTTLRARVSEVQKEAFKTYVPEGGNPPHMVVLACGYCKSGSFLIEIDKNGGDQSYTDQGYHAVGSAEQGAMLIHAVLAHYNVKSRTLLQAKLIAYRIMDAAIETIAFGVGQPVVMWVASANGVEELPRDEIDGIRDTVSTWKEAEAATIPEIITPRAGRDS